MCGHADKDAIDLELAAGEPVTRVAAKFRASADAVSRHFANHLRPGAARVKAIVREQTIHDQAQRLDILAELRSRLERADKLTNIAEGIVGRAAGQQDWRTAVAGVGAATRALGESRACLDLLARLLGEVPSDTTTVNVTLQAEWPMLRQRIVGALEPFPDARQAVLVSLNGHAHD